MSFLFSTADDIEYILRYYEICFVLWPICTVFKLMCTYCSRILEGYSNPFYQSHFFIT